MTQCRYPQRPEVAFPKHDQRDAKRVKGGDFALPPLLCPELTGVDWAIGAEARVSVPEGAVDLQSTTVAEHEVNNGNEAPVFSPDGDLALEGDASVSESLCDIILKRAHSRYAAFRYTECGRFTEPSLDGITVGIPLASAPRGNSTSDLVRSTWSGDEGVGDGDDSLGESKRPPLVLTIRRAVDSTVLRLDLGGIALKLSSADRADKQHLLATSLRTCHVRALSGTGRLASMPQPNRISIIGSGADRTFPNHATQPTQIVHTEGIYQ